MRSFSARPRSHSKVSKGDGEADQQRRRGGDGRAEVLADAAEHLPWQGDLLGAGEEQRHHHFIERGGEGEQRAGNNPGAISGRVTRKNAVSGEAPRLAAARG